MKSPFFPFLFKVNLLVSLFGAGAAAFSMEGEPITLAHEGKADLTIVVSGTILASPKNKRTIEDFSRTLRQITGANYIFETKDDTGKQTGVFIGLSEHYPGIAEQSGLNKRGVEAVVLKTSASGLHIVGNSEAAVRNGIYSVLRDLGCRWYFPSESWWNIPKLPNLSYQADRIEEPDFRFARLFPGVGRPGTMDAWIERNRLSRSHTGYIQHTLGIPNTLFAEHPEYFAMRAGKRTKRQLCIGNPDARKLFISNGLDALRKNPSRGLITVEPPDNTVHCQAPETLAIGNGTPSDAVFFLANETAKAVAKEFPNAYVGLYAYLDHADPPSFDLEPNIYVEVTTNLRRTNLTVEEAIEQFRQKGAQVGVRDYLSVPQWHHGRIGGGSKGSNFVDGPASIAALSKLGLAGYTGEISENWAPNGLSYYLIAQVLWNANTDLPGETDLFFKDMFGSSAPLVRAMYERWRARNLTRIEIVEDSVRRLKKAYAATDDPAVKQRLDQLAMAVYWNYLFYKLEQATLLDPDSINMSDDGILRQFSQWSARIDPTGMIDTYALSRMLTRLGGLKRLVPISEKLGENLALYTNGLNGKWWIADKALGIPDALTVQQKLKEIEKDLAAFRLEERLAPIKFPRDLVPIRQFAPDAALPAETTKAPRVSLAIPKGMPVAIWAKAGETVSLPLAASPQDVESPLRLSCKVAPYLNRDKNIATEEVILSKDSGVWGEGTKPDSVPHLTFKAPASGTYLVSIESTASLVALLLTEDLRTRPLALVPFIDATLGTPRERYSQAQKENLPMYFFWPENVHDAVMVGGRGRARILIEQADGPIWDNPRLGSEELHLIVPAKKALGQVMKLTAGNVSFSLRGFPLLLSPSAAQVLAPLE